VTYTKGFNPWKKYSTFRKKDWNYEYLLYIRIESYTLHTIIKLVLFNTVTNGCSQDAVE